MTSITIRDAQHNLSSVLRKVEAGESVEIRRRKRPVARIVPVGIAHGEGSLADWSGHSELMQSLWGTNEIRSVDSVVSDLRGNR